MIIRDYYRYFLEISPGYSLLPVMDPVSDPFRIHIVPPIIGYIAPPIISYQELIIQETSEWSIKEGGIKTLCGLNANGYIQTMSGILTNKRWKLCSACRERALQLHISASEDSLYGPVLPRNKASFNISIEEAGSGSGTIKRYMVFTGPSGEAPYFNWLRRVRKVKGNK